MIRIESFDDTVYVPDVMNIQAVRVTKVDTGNPFATTTKDEVIIYLIGNSVSYYFETKEKAEYFTEKILKQIEENS